ncbi:efflux RND transporter permease subunit [Wenyingzhuangia sp. 2_MG-2023]|uniref:efflux RND transporter permease subunit n=1 Tax=Wenyingzhuangia sp. 2_MG-2023 TaxID=3062639 RepID=UPI0026E3E951|nr:efflux RND transporter permease subunit [Wenyingzhuangia sp. 2_MG-2023]MDO6736464.1 efflux RND transporter permease subunit [Wenyingzhuangia sp. 2_MG-2023]
MNANPKNYFTAFKKPILFIGLLLTIAGIYAYTQMQTNLFPEVLFPRITLVADVGQQPIDRMMITISKPLESAVKKVKGVQVVKTTTSRGNAVIDVFFDWGTDIYQAKTKIEGRINEIKNYLPPNVNIAIEAMNQSTFPVYGYTLESNSYGLVTLKDQANLIARPIFSQVNGISVVIVRGGKNKEFAIIPNPTKMSTLGITPNTIINAFKDNNYILSNGVVQDYKRLYLSLTETRSNSVEDLKNIILKSNGNQFIKVKDVAQVELKEQLEFIIVNANGHDAVLLDLIKQPGINLIDFAKDCEIKAQEIQKQLPKGVTLKPYYNQASFVGNSIQSVIKTIYEGLFLAILVMILFLKSWRASLVVTLTIPITLAFSILVLNMVDISINIMSLGAIAASIGLIIDDAIVIIEQIYRKHEDHPELDKFSVVKHAIKELFPAMIGSSLATIVIHFPFGLMSGLAGSFFKELSDTMQLTMVTSFLVTWLLLPVFHIIIGFKQSKNKVHISEEKRLQQLSWLTCFFKKPIFAIILVFGFGISAWFSFQKLETGFLPDLDEGAIVLDYYMPPGTSLKETDRVLKEIEKIIIAHPEVETYSRRTGMAMHFGGVPPNYGDYSIQLKQHHTQTTADVITDLRNDISAKYPVLNIEFGQRIADLLGDLMSTAQPIEVKFFGDNYENLQHISQKAEEILSNIPGIEDIDNGLRMAGSSIIFKPRQELLSQYNISLLDFQNQLAICTNGVSLGINANQPTPSPSQAAMTSGLQVGEIQDGEQMRRTIMRYADFESNDIEKIKRQLIFLPNGTTKRVDFFCDIEINPGETEQQREDLKSVVVLTARLDNRDLGSAITEIQNKLNTTLALPKGYNIVYGGAYSEQQKSFKELMLILLTASLLVFGVFMFLFKEWLLSTILLFTSMMGITGSILALYLTNTPLNVSSYTGIIMIVGILAENAIFTISQYQANMKKNNNIDLAINYAIALRIRPKLMTAIGAILALMPLALGIGLGAQMQQPLAIAVIGGFVVGLPMLLIVLPSFIRVLYKRKKALL